MTRDCTPYKRRKTVGGKGSKVAMANKCHDCQRAGCDPTLEVPSVAVGPLLLGNRKRQVFNSRVLPLF